jgi:hypothetical protein
MMLKKSFKIFVSRLELLWPMAIYLGIFAIVLLACSAPFLLQLYRGLERANIVSGTIAVSESTSIVQGYDNIEILLRNIFSILYVTPANFFGSTLSLVIAGLIIARFVLGLHEVPLAVCATNYVSANASIGFIGRFFAEIGVSIKYSLTKIIYNILFDIFFIAAILLAAHMLILAQVDLLLPILVCVLLVFMLALRYAISCCWAGEIVNNHTSARQAFRSNLKLVGSKFGRVYLTYFAAVIILLVVNLGLALITYGIALIVTLPLSLIFITMLNTMVYYNLTQKKYYLDGVVVG